MHNLPLGQMLQSSTGKYFSKTTTQHFYLMCVQGPVHYIDLRSGQNNGGWHPVTFRDMDLARGNEKLIGAGTR